MSDSERAALISNNVPLLTEDKYAEKIIFPHVGSGSRGRGRGPVSASLTYHIRCE